MRSIGSGAVVWLAVCIVSSPAHAVLYSVFNLDTGSGPTDAYDIGTAANGHYLVVGVAGGSAAKFTGVPASIADLGLGPSSLAVGVNDVGQITGYSFTTGSFFYDPIGGLSPLGTLPGGTAALASAIRHPGPSDAGRGRVVGIGDVGPSQFRAFYTSGGVLRDLLADLGITQASSTASDINDAGYIVGQWAETSPGNARAFLVSPNGSGNPLTFLGLNPTDTVNNYFPRAVDGTGTRIVGREDRVIGPFIFSSGVIWTGPSYASSFLGDLPSSRFGSEAFGINPKGTIIVGGDDNGTSERGVVWLDGGPEQDLNDLLVPGTGWTIEFARTVNDAGQIVGQGSNGGGQPHALLLSVCGNKITDPGEQCDDGAANGTPASCCTVYCQNRPDNDACDDAFLCNGPETCHAGVCTHGTPPAPGTVCGDLGACHNLSVCGGGICNPGTVLTGSPCGDGNACHDLSTCSAGTCSAGTPIAGCEPTKSVTGSVASAGATTLTSPRACSCTTDADCGAGGACSASLFQCTAGAPARLNCTNNADCATGTACQTAAVTITIPAGALPPRTPVVAGWATTGNFSVGSGARVASLVKVETVAQPSLPVKIKLGWQERAGGFSAPLANPQVLTSPTPFPREAQLQIFHNGVPIVSDTTACTTASATYPTCAQCFADASVPLNLQQYPYTKATVCNTACGGLECCCDPANNFWEFQTTSLSEFTVASTACGAAARVRMLIANVGVPGAGFLRLGGRFILPAGATLDPLTTGVEIVLGDVPSPSLSVSIPGGAFSGGVGWRVSRRADTWTYFNASSEPPGGIYKVELQKSLSGLVRFAAWGQGGTYAVTTAVTPGIVLPGGNPICFALMSPGPPTPGCRLRRGALLCK